MIKFNRHPMRLYKKTIFIRTTSAALLPIYLATLLSPLVFFQAAYASDAVTVPSALTPPAELLTKEEASQRQAITSPNRTVPTQNRPVGGVNFSSRPSVKEIRAARVFGDPLVPAKTNVSPEETQELAAALLEFSARSKAADISAIDRFLERYPESPWRVSLLRNQGTFSYDMGYFSKAIEYWEAAWAAGATERDRELKPVVDRAFGELVKMHARIGNVQRLEELFAEAQDRQFIGSATELVTGAHEGLWLMKNRPEDAFRCGPMALGHLSATEKGVQFDQRVDNFKSTPRGTSLSQIQQFASSLGVQLRMGKRAPGGTIITPAIVHWKVGHFALIAEEKNGLFRIQDPTFGQDLWIGREAIDAEASGYFLVRTGQMPRDWSAVGLAEANNVWGKGNTDSSDPDETEECDEKTRDCQPCTGMADYNVHALLVSLNITDRPLTYSPGRGPAVDFTMTYNQRDANQPVPFPFSNFGPKWTFAWISYVKDNPSNLGTMVSIYERGGGRKVYSLTQPDGSGGYESAPHAEDRSILRRVGTSPIVYERRRPDGSREIFNVSDGATGSSRRIFLHQIVDPTGASLTLSYNPNFTLAAITDALGKTSTLHYNNPDDALKITKITDPFGRSAHFTYDSQGRLIKITDAVGIDSRFGYLGSGDFIQTLTTPYGTTSFSYGDRSTDPTLATQTRWLEAVDPLGARERVAYVHPVSSTEVPSSEAAVPTGIIYSNSHLNWRNTFYWGKKATMESGANLSFGDAKIFHWMHKYSDTSVAAGVLESEKNPLESRVWYNYPGQTVGYYAGTFNTPSKVARVLDDGSTQLVQYEYNIFGKVTKEIDPSLRETVYEYHPNGIDLHKVKQKNTAAGYDVIAEYLNYNNQHLPQQVIDAARQITSYTYTPTGEVLTTTRTRNGQQEVLTNTYVPIGADGEGKLQSVSLAAAGQTTQLVSYTYDAAGRIKTQSDSDGYTITYDYDALDRLAKVSYPDGTYEQTIYNRLDPEWQRDRLGRWTRRTYDALRRLTSVTDPAGREVKYNWCACGLLHDIIDQNENKTSFGYDIQSRKTSKTYHDGSVNQYVYENTTSRLKKIIDGKEQVTNFEYYKDDGLKQVSHTDLSGQPLNPPTPTVTYAYDPHYNRLTSMADGTGTTTYEYYPITTAGQLGAGRLQFVNGPLAGDTDKITHSYDEVGRELGCTINGVGESRSYDALGRISSITNPLGTFTHHYIGATARLQSVTYPNGQVTSYGYDDLPKDPQLNEIKNMQSSGGAVLSQFNNSYDAVGNIQTWRQAHSGTADAVKYYFGYDRADQLTSAALKDESTGATIKQFGYRYDPAGNRLNEQIDNSVTKASYNNLNQLTTHSAGGKMTFEGSTDEPATVIVDGNPAEPLPGNEFRGIADVQPGQNNVPITAVDAQGNTTSKTIQVNVPTGAAREFSYDLNGNMLSDGEKTYGWDAANRLVKITISANVYEFTYNGAGQRVDEKLNGVTTKRFIWCGMDLREERDATGLTVVKRFFNAGMELTGSNYYYTRDHLGSVREMTDSTGAVRARYDYDSWGRRTKVSGDMEADFGFTGHYFHSPSELHLALFRAYNADFGRWLSRDPLGDAELQVGPNLYEYVFNNPLNYDDPLGLYPPSHPYCISLQRRIRNLEGEVARRTRELYDNPYDLPGKTRDDDKWPSESRRGHVKLLNIAKANLAAAKARYAAQCTDPEPKSCPTPSPSPTPPKSCPPCPYWGLCCGLKRICPCP